MSHHQTYRHVKKLIGSVIRRLELMDEVSFGASPWLGGGTFYGGMFRSPFSDGVVAGIVIRDNADKSVLVMAIISEIGAEPLGKLALTVRNRRGSLRTALAKASIWILTRTDAIQTLLDGAGSRNQFASRFADACFSTSSSL